VFMKTGRLWFQLLLLSLVLAVLSACISPAVSLPETSSNSPLATPGSTETSPLSIAESPLPTATEDVPLLLAASAPSPSPISLFSTAPIRFSLDLPLLPGATRVTGHGPAGQKISIVDVSLGTEELGAGEIGADGVFAVDVKPLPAGDRIGIMAGASLSPEYETNRDLLWGQGGIQLPMFGDVFASAMVQRP
jgi:hypothetical protein